jgi:hypothetical protein
MVRKPKIAKLECEANEMDKEVWCVYASIDKGGAVYVGVREGRKGRRL